MRTRSPARRTLPSRTVATPSSLATIGMLASLPLNTKEDVREETLSCGSLVSRLRISSEMPSLKRSEEHTSELQSLMRISYAVFCLKQKNNSKAPKQHKKTHMQTPTL